MPNVRAGWKNGKWALDSDEFLTAYYYAKNYDKWMDRLAGLNGGLSGVSYDGLNVQTSGNYNATEHDAIERADLTLKIQKIKDAAIETDKVLAPYLMKMATTRQHISYFYLSNTMNIPCGKDLYYEKRHKFYYILFHKIT